MNKKELRDQLDQIARLEEEARINGGDYEQLFLEAIGDFWRSGGRELAEDGERYRWLRANAGSWSITCGATTYTGSAHKQCLDNLIDSGRASSVKEGK